MTLLVVLHLVLVLVLVALAILTRQARDEARRASKEAQLAQVHTLKLWQMAFELKSALVVLGRKVELTRKAVQEASDDQQAGQSAEQPTEACSIRNR